MAIERADVNRGLEREEFVPYFQPQVQLRSGQLAGFEVLARWNHATQGLIPPDEFIPLAERDGWIHALTSRILEKAFRSALSLPGALQLSVNISPIQLRDRTLANQFQEVARRTGFSLERVMVEITESAMTDNPAQARLTAQELKELGCKLTLDDFGTGYSSLRHLQSLPFDELKVDKGFVSTMVEKRDSRKIVAAVIGLGQSLGLTTVAEGVESREQAEMLLWLGCDTGQGWLFGRPQPAENLPAVVTAPPQKIATGIAFPWKNLSIGSMEGLPAQKLAQLQAVYDGAPVGLGFLDRNLRYVNLNRQLAVMGGHSVEEYLGRTAQEIVPDLYAKFEPYINRALQGEAIAGFEINMPAAGATGARTCLVSYQPARDEAGEVVGVSVAALDFTARKQAEEQLQRYERVVEGLEEMIVVIDREYRYVLANRAFLDYRATTREKLLGRSVPDALGKEIFENLVKGKLDECFAGKVVNYELDFTYPDLGTRELQITYIPIEVSGGVTGAACVLRDMTERNRMARANLDWQKRIDLAQTAGLGLGFWDWDLATNTVLWSDETSRQWGYAPGTFSGRVDDATARIHADDLPKIDQAIQDVLAGKKDQFAAQYRVLRPDGTTCWINAHGVVMPDRSGHMVGIGVDITGLKQVEEFLRESEEKYLLLLNSTAEAIFGIDLEGNCTFCNPASLRLLGYATSEEILGKNMHALAHHSYADGRRYPNDQCQIYVAIRRGERAHVADEVMWRRDGTSFPVEYWSYPMHKDGKLVGAVVTFLDISNPRRMQSATAGNAL